MLIYLIQVINFISQKLEVENKLLILVLSSMKIYFAVFFFQVLFNIFKTLEIKYTYEHRVKELMLNSIWINLVSLGSIYLSVDNMLKGNWSVLIVYVAGSVTGKWVAMTKLPDYREKIYKLLKKNKLVM